MNKIYLKNNYIYLKLLTKIKCINYKTLFFDKINF